MSTVILTETMLLPTGCSPDDDGSEWDMFALYVRWQNSRGWIVTDRSTNTRLSVKGRKWTKWVEKRNRHLYYFPTYEEALDAAMSEVNTIKHMGLTYQQWQERKNQPRRES